MFWLMDILGDIFNAIGMICMAIISFCGTGLGVAAIIFVLFSIIFLLAIVWGAILAFWSAICESVSKKLPQGSKMQCWFEKQHLDLKYPSRVRRRKNKRNLQSI